MCLFKSNVQEMQGFLNQMIGTRPTPKMQVMFWRSCCECDMANRMNALSANIYANLKNVLSSSASRGLHRQRGRDVLGARDAGRHLGAANHLQACANGGARSTAEEPGAELSHDPELLAFSRWGCQRKAMIGYLLSCLEVPSLTNFVFK